LGKGLIAKKGQASSGALNKSRAAKGRLSKKERVRSPPPREGTPPSEARRKGQRAMTAFDQAWPVCQKGEPTAREGNEQSRVGQNVLLRKDRQPPPEIAESPAMQAGGACQQNLLNKHKKKGEWQGKNCRPC